MFNCLRNFRGQEACERQFPLTTTRNDEAAQRVQIAVYMPEASSPLVLYYITSCRRRIALKGF